MADLVDRKELRDALYEADAVTMQGVKIINKFPAVNAVPVVRCRECKHRYSDSWCEYVDDNDNFYCAKGERKGGADNG